MLMLCSILFPILAGLGLAAWRPHGRIARQNYVLASACITAALALWAVFTLRDALVIEIRNKTFRSCFSFLDESVFYSHIYCSIQNFFVFSFCYFSV